MIDLSLGETENSSSCTGAVIDSKPIGQHIGANVTVVHTFLGKQQRKPNERPASPEIFLDDSGAGKAKQIVASFVYVRVSSQFRHFSLRYIAQDTRQLGGGVGELRRNTRSPGITLAT